MEETKIGRFFVVQVGDLMGFGGAVIGKGPYCAEKSNLFRFNNNVKFVVLTYWLVSGPINGGQDPILRGRGVCERITPSSVLSPVLSQAVGGIMTNHVVGSLAGSLSVTEPGGQGHPAV